MHSVSSELAEFCLGDRKFRRKRKNDPVQFLRFNRASKSQQKSVSRPWEYLLPQPKSTDQRIEG